MANHQPVCYPFWRWHSCFPELNVFRTGHARLPPKTYSLSSNLLISENKMGHMQQAAGAEEKAPASASASTLYLGLIPLAPSPGSTPCPLVSLAALCVFFGRGKAENQANGTMDSQPTVGALLAAGKAAAAAGDRTAASQQLREATKVRFFLFPVGPAGLD